MLISASLPIDNHCCTVCSVHAEIWDALKAAVEAEDMGTSRLILDTAGVLVSTTDMTVCYDERGGCRVL